MAALYAIGSNGSGQLGIGHQEDVSVPKPALFHASSPLTAGPVTIRAGGNHTLLLTSSGSLFSSGDLSQGARGCESIPPSSATEFSSVNFTPPSVSTSTDPAATTPKITHCAATWESSIAVATDSSGRARDIYTFGTGHKGELGLGPLLFRSSRPQLLPSFLPPEREVVDLAACMGHVVVVLDNGDVYGWGNGRKGQLGEPAEVVHEPRKIEGVTFPVSRAVCGREFTYLLGPLGGSESAFLGKDKWAVKPSGDISGWTDVGAGWGNIMILKDDGAVLSWGRDDHGQCAPEGLPAVAKIAVGSEHTLALTREGDVVAWGWGEHGNCGPRKEGEEDVRGPGNVVASGRYLPEGCCIASIGGGCATSWVCVVGG